jgi:hypothetical protein
MQRFRSYLAAMMGGTDDVVLPIVVANPMAKEHAIVKLDELFALGAEDICANAAAEAAERLVGRVSLDVEVKASLVLADDVGGGWTNRYTTDASVRFPGRGALKRPFGMALVWTSESPEAARLHQDVLAAIHRVVHQQRRGLPSSLRSMLRQEGLAAVFAGARADLPPDELSRARAVLARVGDHPGYPTAFAFMYGDTAAVELGYQPLGVVPCGGFAVALADALEDGADPVQALIKG